MEQAPAHRLTGYFEGCSGKEAGWLGAASFLHFPVSRIMTLLPVTSRGIPVSFVSDKHYTLGDFYHCPCSTLRTFLFLLLTWHHLWPREASFDAFPSPAATRHSLAASVLSGPGGCSWLISHMFSPGRKLAISSREHHLSTHGSHCPGMDQPF